MLSLSWNWLSPSIHSSIPDKDSWKSASILYGSRLVGSGDRFFVGNNWVYDSDFIWNVRCFGIRKQAEFLNFWDTGILKYLFHGKKLVQLKIRKGCDRCYQQQSMWIDLSATKVDKLSHLDCIFSKAVWWRYLQFLPLGHIRCSDPLKQDFLQCPFFLFGNEWIDQSIKEVVVHFALSEASYHFQFFFWFYVNWIESAGQAWVPWLQWYLVRCHNL